MSYYENALKVKPTLDLGYAAQEVGITLDPKPTDLPDRPGFVWKPQQTVAGGAIVWIEEEDPNAQGTESNPIHWIPGMKVQANYWYTYNGVRYVCVQSGNPVDITDTAYFEQL